VSDPAFFSGLRRYPEIPRDPLQAWDRADELLVRESQRIAQKLGPEIFSSLKVLIVEDHFGAISRAILEINPQLTAYSDSWVSLQSYRLNCGSRLQTIHCFKDIPPDLDLVLIRPPKSLHYFEDLLCALSQKLKPGAQVICGVMVKYQAAGMFEKLNQFIGTTHTSLAEKKARLVFCKSERAPQKSRFPVEVPLEGFDRSFLHESNLFSHQKLDLGTRFLLENLNLESSFDQRISLETRPVFLDLGCANGAVGIALKRRFPHARILFTDESAMAVQTARVNFQRHFPNENTQADFLWTDCALGVPDQSVDWVVCNPPFHQGTVVGTQIALEMIRESRRVLKPGGRLRLIGNSHLHYGAKMAQVFGQVREVARDSRFTILEAD
jgi:23S rRNA (guanine1835-N2)-methyltransferase